MRFVFLSALLLIWTSVSAQKYSTGHFSILLKDASRGNRRIPVEIFYPEQTDSTCSSQKQRFPLISFAHGYLLPGGQYMHICDILVPEGYILAFPGSEAGLFPSHKALGKDLSFVSSEVGRLGADKTSPLYDMIDTARCLMGHSMGGGAMFFAANNTMDVTAVAALAPYDTKPSAIQAAASVKVPTLIFAGSNDCITPPEENQVPIYNFSCSHDKTYILIKGGTHCFMGVSYHKCQKGEKMARCMPGISLEEQKLILARYLVPWLNYFLKGDAESGEMFDNVIRMDDAVEYLQSRTLTSTF